MVVDKQEVFSLLSQMIQHRDNDLASGRGNCEVSEGTAKHFTELIIAVTRYLHDIRYCSKSDCPCSPESATKRHYEPIKEYLKEKGSPYALTPIPWKTIEKIIEGETK